MQGEEWDDSMTSIRRIVPKTNEQYVELLKKLVKLITKNAYRTTVKKKFKY